MFFPFFIDLEWSGPLDGEPGPCTPVEAVWLGFPVTGDFRMKRFAPDESNGGEGKAWTDVGNVMAQWLDTHPDTRLCGWDMRRSTWPAVAGAMARHGVQGFRRFMVPVDEKWSSRLIVDIRNLALQGGWAEKFTLDDAYLLATGEKAPEGMPAIRKAYEVYFRYAALV